MKKKSIFLFIAMLLLNCNINAQVKSIFIGENNSLDAFIPMPDQTKSIITQKMPEVNVQKLLQEDSLNESVNQPFRFGYDIDVNYTLDDGEWEYLDSKRIWSMRIYSKDAFSLNFIFNKMHLSSEAELYIYPPDGSMVYGPVTMEQNTDDGTFGTDLIPGESAIIKIMEPVSSKEKSVLEISKVIHGYKDTFQNIQTKAASKCHNNVICFPEWLIESNAVALMLLANGTA